MVLLDTAIVAILALSAIVGFTRGVVRELFSFVVWFGAALIAWRFYRELAVQLPLWIEGSTIRLGVASLILVLAVLIVGAILGGLLAMLVRKTGLTGTNRALGLIFGAGRGAVLVAMLAFLMGLTPLPDDQWWKDSLLVGRFQVLSEYILERVPKDAKDWLKRV